MYDPSTEMGDDSDLEWIELYNNGTSTINLTNWKIDNYNFDDINISIGEYLIIARELVDGSDDDNESFEYYWGNNDGIWNSSDGNYTAIDGYFILSNTEDIINLSNGTFSIILNYDDSLGGDGDGNSLQLINGTWYAAAPTPGYENILISNITNQTQENQTNQTQDTTKDLEITVNLEDISDLFVEYTSLFKIKNLDHETGITDYINVTVFYNISKNNTLIKEDFFNLTDLNWYKTTNTGNIIFNDTGNYLLCGLIINSTVNDTNKDNDFSCKDIIVIDTRTILCNISIGIDLVNGTIYNNNEQITYFNTLNNDSFLFFIEYWIEDLFKNEVRSRDNTSYLTKRTWTPHIDESDQVFLIKNRIAELYCNDTNLSDNSAEKLIIVKGERKKESAVNITKVYLGSDNKAKFGDSLSVRINIYKGDETKNNVKLWLEKDDEKISKITSTNLYTNFINYDLTLSVQIDPNCDEKMPDGDYTLFLTAFDKNDSTTIPISGIIASNCKTTTKYISGGSLEKEEAKQLFEIISIPSEVNQNQKFTSKIKLNNNDDSEHKYTIWSYIYRGNKVYSEGERETNTQELTIPSKSSAVIELKNIALEEGDFNFKIKIRKDEQKTTKDITNSIKVISPAKIEESINTKTEETKELQKKNDVIQNMFLSEKEPKTVYLSQSYKGRKLASFFILFLLALLSMTVLWRKTI